MDALTVGILLGARSLTKPGWSRIAEGEEAKEVTGESLARTPVNSIGRMNSPSHNVGYAPVETGEHSLVRRESEGKLDRCNSKDARHEVSSGLDHSEEGARAF